MATPVPVNRVPESVETDQAVRPLTMKTMAFKMAVEATKR